MKTCYCEAASEYCDFLGEQIRVVAVLLVLWSSDSGGEAVGAALGASVAQSQLLGEEGQSTCAGDGPEISLWHELWEMNPCSAVCWEQTTVFTMVYTFPNCQSLMFNYSLRKKKKKIQRLSKGIWFLPF